MPRVSFTSNLGRRVAVFVGGARDDSVIAAAGHGHFGVKAHRSVRSG